MPLAAFLTRIALIVGAISFAAAGCGFPHFEFPVGDKPDASTEASTPPPDASPEAAPEATPDVVPDARACSTQTDCAGSTSGGICDVDAGRCVQCIPGQNNCPWGLVCDATGKCISGCLSSQDCVAPDGGSSGPATGDPDAGAPPSLMCAMSNKCWGCTQDSDCPPSSVCDVNSSQLCLPGCTANHKCAVGYLCCDGRCIDVATEQCEGCTAGFGDCNGNKGDGCESPLNTVDHCGTCDQKCSYPQQQAWCNMGTCAPGPCIAPYDNCDDFPMNGCEANKDTDVNNCGVCHHVCQNPHGTTKCEGGVCKPTCAGTTFAVCDATAGCTDLKTDKNNCGSCGHVCKGGDCIDGACNCPDTQPPANSDCSGGPLQCGPYSVVGDRACICFCINRLTDCRINVMGGEGC